MAKNKPASEAITENTWHYRYPVGYLASKRAIAELDQYRSLVWHLYGYADDMIDNPELIPLEKLIKDYDRKHQRKQIKREIDKMVPIILRRFNYVGAPTRYKFSEHGIGKSLDIVVDIYQDFDFCHQLRYEVLVSTIHRVMGYYDYTERIVKRFWFNPLYLLARVINLPITIMVYAGVNVESQKSSSLHYWFLQVLMAILLALLIVKLGISVNLLKLVIGS